MEWQPIRKHAEDYSAWSTRAVPHGIDVYIGDGATLTRPLIRRRAGTRIGHAPVATQLHWCCEARVRQAVFTHCGSQIVRSDARRLNFLLRRLGRKRHVDARIACDGCRPLFPAAGPAQLQSQLSS